MDAEIGAQHNGHDGATEPPTMPAQPGARRPAHGRAGALFSLIALLLCVIAAAVGATAYLLRVGPHKTVAPTAAAVSPFSVMYLQRGEVWAWEAGKARLLARLPVERAQAASRILLSPDDGTAMILSAQRVWLLGTGASPEAVPMPPPGPNAWRVLDAAWTGRHAFTLLLAPDGAGGPHDLLARYRKDSIARPAVLPLPVATGHVISLSPDAVQVATLDTLEGRHAFATQYAIELGDIESAHRSVAYRSMGGEPIAGIAWSPDRGTVVLDVPGRGLAIQKSSGKPVLQVPTGYFPVSFSAPAQARLAYVADDDGRMRLHVLILHGERDTAIDLPVRQAPRALAWTPDGRAVLYATADTLWQIMADTGQATRLVAGGGIDWLSAVPASGRDHVR